MPGTLYLVATPIGNLQDITFRAVDVLRTAGVIACEDTRHTRKLLNHLGIATKLISYHEHNEADRADELAAVLKKGTSVAVVSDAGTPGISDPGFRIVYRAIEVGAQIVPIPGPVAFVTAVIASGLPTDAIFFAGFLPSKKSERRRRLREIAAVPATIVFYDSPRRIVATLSDCLEILGDRQAVIARELTKLHEEFSREKLSGLLDKFSSATVKGEIVLVIERGQPATPTASVGSTPIERIEQLEAEGMDRKAALKVVAKELGVSKSELYRTIQLGER